MNIDILMYSAGAITLLAALSALYVISEDMKKKRVNKTIEAFIDKCSRKKIEYKEAVKMLNYIEKNKKYLTSTLYNRGKEIARRIY